jgi:hypothetical protein
MASGESANGPSAAVAPEGNAGIGRGLRDPGLACPEEAGNDHERHDGANQVRDATPPRRGVPRHGVADRDGGEGEDRI